MVRHHLPKGVVHLRGIRYVEGDGIGPPTLLPNPLSDKPRWFRKNIVDDDMSSFVGEDLGDRPAQAGSGPVTTAILPDRRCWLEVMLARSDRLTNRMALTECSSTRLIR